MKLKISLLAFLCLSISATVQQKTTSQTLKIGDKVPEVLLTNILNSHAKSIRLSDYRGKLVLIDFWTTWCSSCVQGFPELDSLQRIYPKTLQVILVNPQRNHNSEKAVEIIIDRVNAWSPLRLKLPIAFQDTTMTRLIAFHTVPTCAWISADGRLIAVTDKDQVTPANIEKIMHGEAVSLKQNSDNQMLPTTANH